MTPDVANEQGNTMYETFVAEKQELKVFILR